MTTASVPAPGDEVARAGYRITRADLLRYAGVSGDHNPIHRIPRIAAAAGYPDVIAHGSLLLALVTRTLTDWLGDPARVVHVTFRFIRPIVVPDDGAHVVVRAEVAQVDGADQVVIGVAATVESAGTVGRGRAVVRP